MSILISYDESGYNAAIYALESAIPHIQEVVDSYLKLSIGSLKPAEFGSLFKDPIGLVFDKITGGTLKIGDLVIKKEKAMELIDVPAGYSEFLGKVKGLLSLLALQRTPSNGVFSANNISIWYTLNEQNKVSLKAEMAEKQKKVFQKFVHTDKGKRMYEFAKAILSKYKELRIDEIVTHKDRPMKEIVGSLFEYYSSTGHTMRVDSLVRYDQNAHTV